MRWFITTFNVDYQDMNASINLFPLLAMKPLPMPLKRWYNKFNRGRHFLTDEFRKGSPKSVVHSKKKKKKDASIKIKRISFIYQQNNFTVKKLICKMQNENSFFIRFLLFWHRVSLFLFYPINIINVGYKKPQKMGKGKCFGHIWGPSSVP